MNKISRFSVLKEILDGQTIDRDDLATITHYLQTIGTPAAKHFSYPKPLGKHVTFPDAKEENEVSVKYYLSDQYLSILEKHKARHAAKGNSFGFGFGFEIIPDDGIANAIVVGDMGRERTLVLDDRLTDFVPKTNITGSVNRKGIRRRYFPSGA